jgi:phosphomannomutase
MYRVGALAALRSAFTKKVPCAVHRWNACQVWFFFSPSVFFGFSHPKLCQVIGVVVTASHNPVQDNGVKIVDPDGGMLTSSVSTL